MDWTICCYALVAFDDNNGLQVTRDILQFVAFSDPRVSPDWVDPRLVSECEELIDRSDKVNVDVNLEVCGDQH